MRPLHGPDDMECGWLGRWLVDRRLEALGHRLDEGFDGGGFDEGDRCACKSGTGHAGAEASLERSGEFDRCVRCWDCDFEIEMQRLVSLVHQPSERDDITGIDGVGRCQGALVFRDDMVGSTPVDRVDANPCDLLEIGVAQRLDTERRSDSLARRPAVCVLRVDETATGAGVEHDDSNGVRQRSLAQLEGAAIDEGRRASNPCGGDELVHDSHGNADDLVSTCCPRRASWTGEMVVPPSAVIAMPLAISSAADDDSDEPGMSLTTVASKPPTSTPWSANIRAMPWR